jgi:hypothetical protein
MSNRCQFVVGGRDYPIGVCDAPASIKREGVWLCADHYDHCEENAVNYVAKDPNWLPAKIHFED